MRLPLRLIDINPKTQKIFLLCLYLLPLVALIGFVYSLGINIPSGDQWGWIKYFERVQAGEVTFSDIFAQHNEHRMVIPRIVFAALAFATNWNTRSEMALSIVCATVCFLAIFLISWQTFQKNRCQVDDSSHSLFSSYGLFHLINFFSGYLLFSWVQYQNWLWGFQIPWFFINTCLALTVLVLYTNKIAAAWRLIGAATLCVMASFSSAHGLFIWLAVIPSVAAISGNATSKQIRKKAIHVMAWMLTFLVCLLVYLIDYRKPPHSAEYYTTSVGTYIGHFLTSLGAPIFGGHTSLWILISSGLLVFLAFFILVLYVLFYSLSKAKPAEQMVSLFVLMSPWISLGSYSIIFSLVNSYGRSGHSIRQALEGRYTTPNSLLVIALLQMLLVLIVHWRIPISKSIASKSVIIGVSALFFVISAHAAATALNAAIEGEHGIIFRERQVICTEVVFYMSDRGLDKCLERNNNASRKGIARLNQLGFRESPQDITFTDATAVSAAKETMRLPNVVNAIVDTENARVMGKMSWPVDTDIMPYSGSQPRAVLITTENKKTFEAVANLDFRTINKRNELEWKTDFTRETVDDILSKNQRLALHLYYPEQKKFVQMDVNTTIEEERE